LLAYEYGEYGYIYRYIEVCLYIFTYVYRRGGTDTLTELTLPAWLYLLAHQGPAGGQCVWIGRDHEAAAIFAKLHCKETGQMF